MKTALLIEDNQDNRYLTRVLLQSKGYAVIEAETGIQGLELAIQMKPDFIVIDIQLPDINGYDVTRRIISAMPDCTIPIIAVTSYAMIGDREKAYEAGCVGYIEKPINPETFVSVLEELMRRAS
jgi:two-component system cell cycle response regulator DivK